MGGPHGSIARPAGDTPGELLRALWRGAGGPEGCLARVRIEGHEQPTLPSIFRVGHLAAATTCAAGLAAAEIHRMRTGVAQGVRVHMRHAEVAFLSERYLQVDGDWEDHKNPLWGYYRTRDGRWVQLHTTFPHHLAGHMALLGCEAAHAQVTRAVAGWDARVLEDAMAERMLPGVMMRSRAEWAASEQGKAVAALPLEGGERPLSGLRVLDLTKVIAGPVCGRTLAEHGAEVMRVHARRLPFVPRLVIDTNRGKRSCFLDLAEAPDRESFDRLLADAHVVTQGHRPGALARLGYGPEEVAAKRPGIVYLQLCAWSHAGPWAPRRGFDSLVQMASGIAQAGARAAGVEEPTPLPCQALDHATGYLAAFGVLMAKRRQMLEGGSWRVRVSLAQTGEWLHELGRIDAMHAATPGTEAIQDLVDACETPFGTTRFVRPVVAMEQTGAYWERGSVPLGFDEPRWA